MNQSAKKALRMFWFAGAFTAVLCTGAWAAEPNRVLRVCADPDNFPFSNERLEGFENKIAQVLADDLKASLTYVWHPERRGFIRETLKAGRCELIIGVPTGYDLVLTTKPYYRSTYVFVYAKNKNLDVRSFDDPALRKINIGVHAFGEDGGNSPAVHALARRGIVSNVIGFPIFATEDSPPGKLIDAVSAGKIDVAIAWGPFAGYFARRQPVALEVMPVSTGADKTAQPFTFDISMGVKPGNNAFREQVEGILERRRDDIRKILEDFGVPLVSAPVTQASNVSSPQSEKQ